MAACGADEPVRAAGAQVRHLGWHENCGTDADALPISTRRLVVRPGRWRVDASFRNETTVTLLVFYVRPHIQSGTYFGLEPFETASPREVTERVKKLAAKPRALADRFSPPLPRVFPPGAGWTGSFSGPGSLPAQVPIRVVLGRFEIIGPVPAGLASGFLCISERVIRLE